MALGEIATRTSGEFIYEELEIPSLTSLTISDSRINLANKELIGVYNQSDRHVMRKGDGAFDLDQNIFLVDDVAQTIEFHSSALNKSLYIQIPVSTTDISCIGGNSSNGEFYDFSFEGSFFTTADDGPYTVVIPHLRRITTPSLSVGDGLQTIITIGFQAVCADDDDYERKPFRIYAPHCFPRDEAKVLLETGEDVVLREEDTIVLREELTEGCEDITDTDLELPESPGDCLLHEDLFDVLYEDGCFVCFETGGAETFFIATEEDDDMLQENDDKIEQEQAP